MRERSCAEMLCVVLLNCPQLRTFLFQQFADQCGWRDLPLAELDYEIETEQAVGGKRDDLRIVGFDRQDETRPPVLLWTIEIKVQAGIHDSSRESYDEEEELGDDFAASVTQLENYDRWLEVQTVAADRKAGIVLAIPSHARHIAELVDAGKLRPRWHCLRWTDLGNWIEQRIDAGSLPLDEKVFAEHLLGFLLRYLQDPTEMSDHRIEIEDLALIRAYAQQGKACAKRIDNLVAPLLNVVGESSISFHGPLQHQRVLFGTSARSTINGVLIPSSGTSDPNLSLWAGVHKDQARLWISVHPKFPLREQVKSVAGDYLKPLQARNPAWTDIDPEDSTWHVIGISKPLAWILAEEDQAAAIAEFVRGCLEDLTQLGVTEALQLAGASDA
ncbi:hypothetical protein LOC68_10910 [Blastopirellula sp. JC732]|uniref:PD-(D/E)XK nuclease family protein n=1 Tax=Blastopirellula sediminis TaxID=2894196 RepID=A0A9X1MMD0_9BACT|nr:hypothetical protein [Blastopirellula sediminis]MCC9608313.1 hypothetical protein [Blastopirellula sediminis]MCC9628910.1 hypothetical protein [Blastopirellula sediminis]